MRKVIEKNKKLKILFLAVFMIIYALFCSFAYTGYIRQNVNYPLADETLQGMTDVLHKGDVLVQDFIANTDEITSISLMVNAIDVKMADSEALDEMEIILLDFSSMERLTTRKIAMSQLISDQYVTFAFDQPVQVKPGTKLRIVMVVTQDSTLRNYRMYYGLPRTSDSFDGEYNGQMIGYNYAIAIPGNKSDNIGRLYIGISIWFGIFLVVLFFMLFVWNIRKMEWIYLATALGLGMIFMILIPEYETPDELTHSYTAYSVSDQILGNVADKNIDMRNSDYNSPYLSAYPDRARYNSYLEQLVHPDKADTTIVQTENAPLPVARYSYYMSGLGITIGRLLKMSTVRTYFLGSLFNYIFFVLLTFYAIRKTPIGKAMLLLIANLSITLQQATSYSYDCMVLALSFVVIALSLKLYFEKGEWKKKEIVALVAAVLLLVPLKGCTYIFVCAMALLPVWSLRKTKPKIFRGIEVFFVIVFFIIAAAMFHKIATPSAGGTGGYVAWASEEGFTMSYLLRNPGRTAVLLFNTVFHEFDNYLYQILGGELGWLKIKMPWFVVYLSGILLLGCAVKTEEENYRLHPGVKAYIFLMTLTCLGVIMLGLLLTWTPISSGYVLGVQGRYFLPFFPMLLLLIYGDGLTIKEKYHRYFVYAYMMLEPLILFTIVHNF